MLRSRTALIFLTLLLPAQTLAAVGETVPVPAVWEVEERNLLLDTLNLSETVSRADLVKMLVGPVTPEESVACFANLSPSEYWLLFSDVEKGASYGPQLCRAISAGLVRGYADGTFRPDNLVNLAEASKLITKTYGLAMDSSDPNLPWYRPYTNALAAHDALPNKRAGDTLTKKDITFIISALREYRPQL